MFWVERSLEAVKSPDLRSYLLTSIASCSANFPSALFRALGFRREKSFHPEELSLHSTG